MAVHPVIVSASAGSGKTYRIAVSSNLNTWSTVNGQGAISGTGGIINRTMNGWGNPPASGRRYFRVEETE